MDILPIRPHVKLDAIIDCLRRALSQVQTTDSATSGPGNGTYDRIDRYLRWTEDTEPQLRNVFEPEYAAELVRTTGYWTLRTISPDAVRADTLVRGEYEGRSREFERLLADLKAERVRWERKAAPLIVPDTSMFLDQSQPFASVDWPALANANVDVRLVVPLIVIHELDRLKRQGNSTTATLARGAIRWLSDVLPLDVERYSDPFRPGPPASTVEVYVHSGPARPEDADGMIIAFSSWSQAISGLITTLITRDLGMALRARSSAVDAVLVGP